MSWHVSYIRRMSPLAELYSRERAVPVCLETLTRLGFDLAADSRIKLDLDDRPQKNPRACVIASDPPSVVHLITRAQGGLHDYQALLHEAGMPCTTRAATPTCRIPSAGSRATTL